MGKIKVKGKVTIEYQFKDVIVPDNFNYNEIDEAIIEAIKKEDVVDWDNYTIEEIIYDPIIDMEEMILEEDKSGQDRDEEWYIKEMTKAYLESKRES